MKSEWRIAENTDSLRLREITEMYRGKTAQESECQDELKGQLGSSSKGMRGEQNRYFRLQAINYVQWTN